MFKAFKSTLLLIVITIISGTALADESAVSKRLAEEEKLASGWLGITPHRSNYILPYTYNSTPNDDAIRAADPDAAELDNYEAKFQISFKVPVWKDISTSTTDLYFAYTQISHWQAYHDDSAPFRDTNYEPEVFLWFDNGYELFGFTNSAITLGFVHQSNGRGLYGLSRSWNRLYASFLVEQGNFAMALKGWYRIPEDEEEDDNSDIDKYLGYGDLRLAYKWGNQVFSALWRNNLRAEDNKGAIELGWSFPLSRNLKGYVQYFNGYGESLIDYDHTNNRIGVGVMLNDLL